MSDLRGRRSPYEQGELKPSPQRHSKKKKSSKKSKKSHRLPPEAKLHINKADEDDDIQIIEAVDHGEEEGGSLTIKPPQTQASKLDKIHKHKKDKHKPRPYPTGPRDHPFSTGQKRDVKDAREIVRERKKERELKEKEVAREISKREARKREESTKERERLEMMELERRRERQAREEHEKEKEMRQRKRKEDRRQLLDTRREKIRGEGRPPGDHFRSRSRDDEKNREKFHQISPQGRVPVPEGKKESSKGGLPLTKSSSKDLTDKSLADSDQDTRRVVVDSGGDPAPPVKKKEKTKDYKDAEKEVIEKVHHSPHDSEKMKEAGKKEEEEEDDDENGENDSEGDSDSDSDSSDSDSSSEEEEEDSSEEEEDDDEEEEEEVPDTQKTSQKSRQHEKEDRTDDGRDKLRSKFDDHSDIETPGRRSVQSHSEDEYLPESPEMSDVEENLEDSLPVYLPAIQGCRSVEEFNCLNRIEEGTYGVVYRALDKKTNEIVALKRLKMEKEKEGFPITSLREINTLLKAQHENIVTVREIVVGNNMDKIYIVMDFVEHDLKSLMENMKNPFLVGEVKTLLQQLLRAVRHLHDNWILHRDLKTSNLLLSHKGILKVGDFGLAREYGSPLRNYTPVVVTLWYRAPELLLGCKEYSTLVDMWSVGCIFAEFLLMKALWPGKSEIDQINKIFKDLGTPTEKIWPGVMDLPGMKKVNFNENPYNIIRNRFGSYFTDGGFDLMNRFFAYDPKKRITADDALKHDYFSESPLPVDPSMFPTWPARSEQTKKSVSSPKPPSGGKAYQKLMDEEENITAGGFHMPSAGKGVMAFSLKF